MISPVSASIEGLLLDVDGVLVSVWEPIPGAPEALAAVRRAALPFLLMTNTTTHTRAEIAETLGHSGFEVEPGQIVTSPVATAAYLRATHPGARCWLLGGEHVIPEMDGIEFVGADPDVVVVAGADDLFTWDNVSRALAMLLDGARLVSMHRNLKWMTEDGLRIDAGAYLAALEAASGIRAEVAGKPAAAFFRSALALLGVPAERAAMVGDDIETDVLAAQAVGLTGILVQTGKTGPEEIATAPGRPDHVIRSIAHLPELLGLLG
jgi:HAD superfamily hydrolase (TIGR01458 family)